MMSKKIYLIVLSFIILAACNNEKTDLQSFDLIGEEIKLSEVIDPHLVYTFDTTLIIKEETRGAKCLALIDLRNDRFLHRVGWVGKGAGEIVSPADLVTDKKTNTLWLSDWGKKKIFKLPFDSILNNPDFLPKESIPLDKSFIPMMNLFYHPSGNFGFTSYYHKKELIQFLDESGSQNDTMNVRNNIIKNLWDGLNYVDNPFGITYNSKLNIYFLASIFTNYVAFLDQNGNVITEINEFPYTENPGSSNEQLRQTFYQINSNEKYIYCLYMDKIWQEFQEGQTKPTINYPNRIYVFDWDGNLKYNIVLDHPVWAMAIDDINNRIIALSQDFENQIVSYNVSKIINNE